MLFDFRVHVFTSLDWTSVWWILRTGSRAPWSPGRLPAGQDNTSTKGTGSCTWPPPPERQPELHRSTKTPQIPIISYIYRLTLRLCGLCVSAGCVCSELTCIPSTLMVMFLMVIAYLLPRNCTCSMPSNPQRMKETWEIHEATGESKTSPGLYITSSFCPPKRPSWTPLLTKPHVL